MNRSEYWKNFMLGKELDISGGFIYNGLLCFHKMEHFGHEEEIFEFFYNISVGIERLLKVCIILTEQSGDKIEEELKQFLKTHNHQELLKRIKDNHKIGVSKVHNDFIEMIAEFYKLHRYGLYSLESVKAEEYAGKVQLRAFIKKHLEIEIEDNLLSVLTQNDKNIKKRMGKIIGKIVSEIFEVVKSESSHQNIRTFKTRYDSKASKVFSSNNHDFFNEDRLCKELLIYFVNKPEDSGQLKFIKSIEPLDFDPACTADYIQCLLSDVKRQTLMDQLEHFYEAEVDNLSERKEHIDAISQPDWYWDDGEADC